MRGERSSYNPGLVTPPRAHSMNLSLCSETFRFHPWPNRLRGLCRRSEGQALVEFSLILPMMMILIVGLFCLGIMLNNYMVLTNIVGSAARNLALDREITLAKADPCQYAINLATINGPSLNMSAVTWTILWTTTDPTSGKTSTGTYNSSAAGTAASCPNRAMVKGDNVSVAASYPLIFYEYGLAPTSGTSLTATSVELMQ